LAEDSCAAPVRGDGGAIVILRHGRTEHNKLGLFTGWEDAGLATEGRAEARVAGAVLRAHGFEIDAVYTSRPASECRLRRERFARARNSRASQTRRSWLSRAIETAWITLNELDCLWVPIVKTWRLNERMSLCRRLTSTSRRHPTMGDVESDVARTSTVKGTARSRVCPRR
jgi:2,3-bisphosphoglycerate-dependent phosphoglycerate mutase